MEKRVCPVCSSDKNEILFHQSFSGFSDNNLLDKYDVVACNNCNFCYADNIPSQSKFDIYYKELSKYENFDTELKESPFDKNRFSIMVNYLKEFLPNTKTHIVEVGCATGFLLSLIKKEGYEHITGIDPSPSCSQTAKKYYDIKVLTNTVSSIELEENSVDFLLLVGVLEHIRDLDDSLQKLKKLLKPNGKFFIAIPDGSEYYNGEDAPFQEFSVEHINFFGPKSLENLMNKNGFSKVDIRQQLIEVNYKTLTPVILSVFNNENYVNNTEQKDVNLKINLEKYIELSKKKDNDINEIIKKYTSNNDKLIVWGTGAQTLRLLKNSALKDALITAFVDSNPKYQGKTLNNIPVISPNELKNRTETILISTRAYQNEIEMQIKNELGLNNVVIKLF